MTCRRLLAILALTSAVASAQDVITPLGDGLYRVEFWTETPGLEDAGEDAPWDSVLVRAIYGADDAVAAVVSVAVETERDSLRFRYRVGNGPEGPRPIFRFELLAEAYAGDRRTPDATWRAGAYIGWDREEPYKTTHYSWAQTRNFNAEQTAYLPMTLQPGVSLDGFSLLSAGLPAVVEARASAYRHLFPEDPDHPVFLELSVGQAMGGGRTPNFDRLSYERRHAPFRTLGPRAVPDPFDGPAFLDTLATDIAEADGLGWLGSHGARVGGLFAEGRAAWSAGDLPGAAEAIGAAALLAEAPGVTSEGRALIGVNAAYLLALLPEAPINPLRVPAAVVATGGTASYNGNAFVLSGAAHALDGTPSADPAAAALVAPTDESLATVLAALSGRQREQFDGAVETQPLVFSPGSWAETLAARATVTVRDRPGDLGSADAPVVVYAPAGARFSGRDAGWGVLVADGPVSFRGNARWTGLIIAGGGLDVSGSASVVGGAVVMGALDVGGSAEILYSPEALALARATTLTD